MRVCPHCGGAIADTFDAEIEHMTTRHPEIVAARLRAIGEDTTVEQVQRLAGVRPWRFVCDTCEHQVGVLIPSSIALALDLRCYGRPLEGPDSAEDHGPMRRIDG